MKNVEQCSPVALFIVFVNETLIRVLQMKAVVPCGTVIYAVQIVVPCGTVYYAVQSVSYLFKSLDETLVEAINYIA